MIRTGHSFRAAVGHLPDVISRLREIGWETAPIADRLSTYAFVKWTKLAEEAGLRPVYGVELPVTPRLGDISPTLDHWTFLSGDALRPLHDLIARATANPGKQPSLTYAQATAAMDRGVVVMAGEAALLEVVPREVPLRLSPATPRGQGRMAMDQGRTLVAAPSNYYPREADREFYRVALGRNSYTRTYPCHIVSDEEWLASLSWMPATALQEAQDTRHRLLGLSTARLKRATLLRPPKPHSLRDLCLMGAGRLGLDVASDPVYSERLDRELRLIAEKDFEDYFFIIADMMAFARERMVVGPARGSSCGSLVCYLLGITAIDPIKFGLIFERFIDTTRADLPDIDLDFSDTQRHLVFEYMTEKYGADRTARLGTVGFIKAKTTMRTLGSSLRIPEYRINEVSNTIIFRNFGDSRGGSTMADTFTATDVGKKFSEEFPEARDMAMVLENHPSNAGQHAAGVVLTEEPVLEYVAVDSRTGATMCDKRDAEDLNLLKIDALGLSQLSIFERCLELIGQSPRSDFLEALPLDDQAAYDVLNAGKFAGIFQFTTGTASTHLVEEMTRQGGRLTDIEDIVSLTAIVRPGPLGSGAAERWIRRRCGIDPVTYSHPSMEPYLSGTYGIVVYQEQVMNIGREVGGLSWDDVTALRKAMSKSLGKEYFDKFGDKWKAGAASMHGLVGDDADRIWDDLTTYGMWAFNRCLDGDTLVELADTGSHHRKHMSLAELWDMYHGDNPLPNVGRARKPRLFSLVDGTGVPQNLLAIHRNGRRPCLEFTFDDGSKVTCTSDHKFIINDEWGEAGSSEIGDLWATLERAPPERTVGRGKGHSRGKKWGDTSEGRSGSVNAAWINGKTVAEQEFRESHTGMACEDCGESHGRMEVHHNDLTGGNERPSDLAWLCPGCHKRRHYAVGRTRRHGRPRVVGHKRLTRVEYVGERQTYDVEMPAPHNFQLANGLVTHNSHSVAYGVVSYWCCWLKAHHPLEYAAAYLDSLSDPYQQIETLKELRDEGVDYVAVDADLSTDRWVPGERDGRRIVVGPLTNVRGIGPKNVMTILSARARGEQVPDGIRKKLALARTPIDSLSPIADAVRACDLAGLNIVSSPTPIAELVPGQSTIVFAQVTKVAPLNENEPSRVAKRGGRTLPGPTASINIFVRDDTGEVFAKIGRYDFERLGQRFLEKARPGKSLFAIKGRVPPDFRMISITDFRYLGEAE